MIVSCDSAGQSLSWCNTTQQPADTQTAESLTHTQALSLTYDDASWSSVHLCHLVVHAFVVARLSHHLIGSLVALHAGIVQPRREASTARPLKVLVVLCL